MCKYLNAYAKCQSTNREIKTAKCLLSNEIAKFSSAKFYRVKFSSAKFSRPTVYTNIAESRIERDYWPRFARYAHAARQLCSTLRIYKVIVP